MVECSSRIVVGWAALGNALQLHGFLGLELSWDGELGVPVESLQGNRATSQIEVGNSGFLLS